MTKSIVLKVYQRLLDYHGPQGWWPLSQRGGYHPQDFCVPTDVSERFEMSVGAILVQNTSWRQVEKVIDEMLQKKLLFPEKILSTSAEELQEIIRPAGYFRQKSEYLKNYSEWFLENQNQQISRENLLTVKGVGPETADSILLFAWGQKEFVIDAYTKRIFANLNLCSPQVKYEKLKNYFQNNLPADVEVYQEYHALLVKHAKLFYARQDKDENGCYPQCFLYQELGVGG